jgi:hypothetical protein
MYGSMITSGQMKPIPMQIAVVSLPILVVYRRKSLYIVCDILSDFIFPPSGDHPVIAKESVSDHHYSPSCNC